MSEENATKQYPEEAKKKLETLMEETKEVRKFLDELDDKMAKTASPTEDTLKQWSREAIGRANYLRKKHAKLAAIAKNEKLARAMEIKLDFIKNNPGKTFYANAADTEASDYIAPLRLVRDIIESYVVSADNLISVCRLNLYKEQKENSSSEVDH